MKNWKLNHEESYFALNEKLHILKEAAQTSKESTDLDGSRHTFSREDIFKDDIKKIEITLKKRDMIEKFLVACDGGGCMEFEVEPISNASTYQIGLTHIDFDDETNTLHVAVRRPGILIGKGGSNINRIENELGCSIQIHENTVLGV